MTDTDERRHERVRRALDHLRNGTTDQYEEITAFEAGEFTDPALAQRERELIFGRVPTIVAHTSEIARPNQFVTVRLVHNNVIVVRQKDGSVKTFVNLCRHRGAMLEKQDRGSCRLFSCPYHRWSYDIDGSLRTITRDTTFGDPDRSRLGLVELPTQERHGFVWVVDDADAGIDVASWLGPEMDEILRGYEVDRYVSVDPQTFAEPVNWKIMQDAFLDGYHIQYAHPNTAAKHIHTNVMAFEDFGRHGRWVVPRKSIDRWIEEEPEGPELVQHVTETHFLLPNSTLLRHADHFQLLTFRPHPVDPARSTMEMRVLAPTLEDSGMEPDRWERRWQKNWEILRAVLEAEDFPLLRDSQVGMASRDAGGMLLGRNEVANQVFRRETRKLLEQS